jgi:hypothetical protein
MRAPGGEGEGMVAREVACATLEVCAIRGGLRLEPSGRPASDVFLLRRRPRCPLCGAWLTEAVV